MTRERGRGGGALVSAGPLTRREAFYIACISASLLAVPVEWTVPSLLRDPPTHHLPTKFESEPHISNTLHEPRTPYPGPQPHIPGGTPAVPARLPTIASSLRLAALLLSVITVTVPAHAHYLQAWPPVGSPSHKNMSASARTHPTSAPTPPPTPLTLAVPAPARSQAWPVARPRPSKTSQKRRLEMTPYPAAPQPSTPGVLLLPQAR